MTLLPILVGIVLVVAIIMYVIVRDHPYMEGFTAAILSTPNCPDNYTFFNDKRGDSFCCAGRVNPYTHTCDATGLNGLCAMRPNMTDTRKDISGVCWKDASPGYGFKVGWQRAIPIKGGFVGSGEDFFFSPNTTFEEAKKLCELDPECVAVTTFNDRGSNITMLLKDAPTPGGMGGNPRTVLKKKCVNTSKILPMCPNILQATHYRNEAKCPGNLPNYASIGKCCMTKVDLTGRDCRKPDNDDKKRYCKLYPPLAPGEQLCNNLKMEESANCPSGFAKISYQLGNREVQKYGAAAAGVQIPVCFGMDKTCIPDATIKQLQSKGIYSDKNPETWEYSCKGWQTVNVNHDYTQSMDKTYI